MHTIRTGQWSHKLRHIPKPVLSARRVRGAELAGEWRAIQPSREERQHLPVPLIRSGWEAVAAARILDSLQARIQSADPKNI